MDFTIADAKKIVLNYYFEKEYSDKDRILAEYDVIRDLIIKAAEKGKYELYIEFAANVHKETLKIFELLGFNVSRGFSNDIIRWC